MRGLLTLKDLNKETIIDLIEYALKIKNGYKWFKVIGKS